MTRTALMAGAAAIAGLGSVAVASADDGNDTTAIRASVLHVGDGTIIENAVVLVVGGRIVGVGPGIAVPGGARSIDVKDAHVTPGLIDADALIEPRDAVGESAGRDGRRRNLLREMMGVGEGERLPTACDGVPICPIWSQSAGTAAASEDGAAGEHEQVCPVCSAYADPDDGPMVSGVVSGSLTEASSEVVPHTRVMDVLDLRSPDFDRLLRGGVTTVYAGSDAAAVIGPRGAIVRTGGDVKTRIVEEASDVMAAFSSDTYRMGASNTRPSRRGVMMRTRRPNSRMGVAWVFRKAFYDAEEHGDAAYPAGDAASAAAMRVVSDIRGGAVGLRILARTQRDIAAAMRAADEFGLSYTLIEPVEAYRCIDEIKAAQCPVIFGPIYIDPAQSRGPQDETEHARLSTPRTLHDAGVPVAITARHLREEDGLVRQAMYAVRGGLSPGEAIRAVTSVPARLLGIAGETGTLESGKRADLVVWSRDPLGPASRPVLVMIGGEIVLDDRPGRDSDERGAR